MKKGARFAVAGLLILVIGVPGAVYFFVQESLYPRYEGKRISAWLWQAVGDKDPVARQLATQTLINALPEVPLEGRIVLMKHLGDQEHLPPEILPLLLEALRYKDMRGYADFLFGRLKGEGAVPALVEMLRTEKEPEVRRAALEALKETGPQAKAAVPALREALSDPDLEFRKEILDALKQIEGRGPGR